MADETPEQQPETIPAPAAFLTMAEAAKANVETMFAAGAIEESNSWRTIEEYLRAGARAAATVPPEAQLIVAQVLRIVATLNPTKIRSVQRHPEAEHGRAYVPWALLAELVQLTEAAFPGMIGRYTGKDYGA